jgi:hypothetical protein
MLTHIQNIERAMRAYMNNTDGENDDALAQDIFNAIGLAKDAASPLDLKPELAEPLVFLNDHETFSGISGSAILLGNYDRAYDIRKLLLGATRAQLAAAETPVLDSMVENATT